MPNTKGITIRSIAGQKYDRIVKYELTEKPAWDGEDAVLAAPEPEYAPAEDDIVPF